MKKSKDADPTRWRDLPPSRSERKTEIETEIETEIGNATRLLGGDAPPDELRLAQLRQRILPRLRVGTTRASWFAHPWLRVAALVMASLGLGGVATAVTGRLIAKYRRPDAKPPAAAAASVQVPKRRARRWRVAVNAPTQLDLAVGPDGTDLEVVEGHAEISTPDVPGTVSLDPGGIWRDGVPAVVPVKAAPSLPARATPVAITREPEPGPRPRHEVPRKVPRTIARAEVQRTPPALPALPEASPPAFEPSLALAPVRALPNPLSVSAPAPLPSEASLLGRALRRLRADRDPRGALLQLDEHDRRFPDGPLGREAALTRAEALLALDRKATALAVLDALKLEATATDRRAALARGELRAAGGRRADAIADFDTVLESDADDDIGARALFGRAVLSARAGDTAGARDDLREYVRRFPSGSRRFEAARMLRRLGD